MEASHIVDFGPGGKSIGSGLLSAAVFKGMLLSVSNAPPVIGSAQSLNSPQTSLKPVSTPVISSAQSLHDEIFASIRAVIGQDDIDLTQDSSFSDCGLSSRMMAVLSQVMSKKLGIAVPYTFMFDYPTVKEIAAILFPSQCASDSVPDIPSH